MWRKKKNPYENKEIRVYLKSSEPGSRRLVTPPPRTAAKQPPPGTVDGAEDAGFSLHVRLRRCAAVRPEHALLSREGLQQVQGGTGESEDAPLCCRSSDGVWRRFGRLRARASAMHVFILSYFEGSCTFFHFFNSLS